jgi:hypothetical protein
MHRAINVTDLFHSNHYGDCNGGTVTKWCRCPDGDSDSDNCQGFMSLCYCTPEAGLSQAGVWGVGTGGKRMVGIEVRDIAEGAGKVRDEGPAEEVYVYGKGTEHDGPESPGENS